MKIQISKITLVLFASIQIFAPSLGIGVKHIALLLLSVFAITVLPFNLLHHHAEHDHVAAMMANHPDEHSCELDNQFCHQDIHHHCEHQSHIAAPIAKCLSCEFHFIKHFESCDLHFHATTLDCSRSVSKPVQTRLLTALLEISNKGPPCI